MNYRNQQLGDCDFFRRCASAVPTTAVQAGPSAAPGSAGQCECEQKEDWWLWLLIGYLAWRAYAKK